MKNLVILLTVISLLACTEKKSSRITTAPVDYNTYLATHSPSEAKAQQNMEFWQSKLDKDSIALVSLGGLAGTHTAMFGATGNVEDLYKAETLIKRAYEVSAREKDSYLRSLAHNYISQHRFKEAKKLLDTAYTYPDNHRETRLMLFDVAMELGDYPAADTLLGDLKNNSDYNYLIRQAKFNDHQGNLDAAIRNLEKAKSIAESSGNKGLRIWTYSNLGDFYGHAGRITDAYNHYLMTLKLQPDNAYAKKGIAWIVYSHEKNTQEANRILDSVMVNHKVPDYHLLKAEMAEYDGDEAEAARQNSLFLEAVTKNNYGAMYNTYLIELYADEQPEKALALAEEEVANRATPETYQLLAYAQLKAGKSEEALQTIQTHVEGKTFEPMALYHAALVYKANGMNDELPAIKKELGTASFEIGPVLEKEVKNL